MLSTMFPGPALESKVPEEQTLSRLAEIAEAVSRQNHAMSLVRAISAGENKNGLSRQLSVHQGAPLGAVASALRKRPAERSPFPASVMAAPAPKRVKVDKAASPDPRLQTLADEDGFPDESDDMKDVRFREYQAEIWSEKFEDLCEFRRQFGHCHVPHTYTDNAPLAQWVKRQRYQYKLKAEGKRSTLSDERVRLLNNIGFIWNSHDVVWEERWNELSVFKHTHGHCIVPSNYESNPQLAVWVKRQRRQYKFYQENKATSMTPERIEKLNKLGFAWDCRKNNTGTQSGEDSDGTDTEPTVASNTPPAASAKADVPIATKQTKPPLLVAMEKKKANMLRGVGGFPLPKAPHVAASVGKLASSNGQTVAAVKLQQSPGNDKFESDEAAAREPSTPEVAALVPKMSCEFFSFSRKFTKFPKIKLPNKF